jgi:hypothetical protein
MISLYDYLGVAAGKNLGKQVAEYAKIRKIKCAYRDIKNPSYKGVVNLYEKSFIKEFFEVANLFKGPNYTEINTQLEQDSFRLNEK